VNRSAVAWEEYLSADDAPPRRSLRLPRRRTLIGVLTAAALLVAGAVLLADPGSPAQSGQRPDDTTAPITTWRWERTGMLLPVSSADGPQNLDDSASGFAQTPLGAALAAAHLSVRIDPMSGPDVYRQTIQNQMAGDTARVIAAVDAQYQGEAGQGQRVQPATISAYRIDDYSPTLTTVHLLVASPTGTSTDFAVPVTWDNARGDWLLQAPADDATSVFPTADPGAGYTRFLPEEAP